MLPSLVVLSVVWIATAAVYEDDHDAKRLRNIRAETLQCPLSRNNRGFKAVPSSAASENACGVNGDNCCGDDWFSNVRNGQDPFTMALNSKLTSPPRECAARVKSLSCGVCSKNQLSIVDSKSYTGYVVLCHSFCTALLQDCASANWDDQQVGTKYANKEDTFCHDLFSNMGGNISIHPIIHQRFCFTDQTRECSENDVTGHYTECDLTTNSRSYYYRYVNTSACVGGISLPPRVSGLPCAQSCQAGSYLPLAGSECKQCDAGTYSLGGGYLFNQWKDWPQVFEWESYCEETDGMNVDLGTPLPAEQCKGWVVNDTWVETDTKLSDKQNAVLLLKVNLVRAGSVTFAFKVDAEPQYDGLKFKVDDATQMTIYSNAGDFINRTFPLTSGVHILKWVFFQRCQWLGRDGPGTDSEH
jgi:hypothetical protein